MEKRTYDCVASRSWPPSSELRNAPFRLQVAAQAHRARAAQPIAAAGGRGCSDRCSAVAAERVRIADDVGLVSRGSHGAVLTDDWPIVADPAGRVVACLRLAYVRMNCVPACLFAHLPVCPLYDSIFPLIPFLWLVAYNRIRGRQMRRDGVPPAAFFCLLARWSATLEVAVAI